jgi:hypothetical protein
MSARRILGLEARPKGRAVRPLKRYASWVQTVVRQVGLISAVQAREELRGALPLVREDREWTDRWCASCRANGRRWVAMCGVDNR